MFLLTDVLDALKQLFEFIHRNEVARRHYKSELLESKFAVLLLAVLFE